MNALPRTDAWAASNAHSTVHYRLQADAEPTVCAACSTCLPCSS